MNEIQNSYNLTVKHNLRAFLFTAGYKIDQWGSFDTKEDGKKKFNTLADLCRKLSEKANTEDLAKKLKKLFSDENGPYLEPYLIKEICESFKFPFDRIYSAEAIPEEKAAKIMSDIEKYTSNKNHTNVRHSYDCHELTDPAFMGKFYGYCRNTQYENEIENFVMTIEPDFSGSTQATLVLAGRNQKSEAIQKTLYGKPFHLEPYIIQIHFQSDVGDDMFTICYSWFKLNLGKKLYCRYGSLTTPCRSTVRYPQQQAFIMLDKPIPPENMHFVDGFLRLSQDKIIVPADKYDVQAGGLMATDENVKAFFDQCNDLLYSKEEYYCFSEKVLLAMGEAHGIDYDTTAAAIMTLKENSINPKVVDFPNNKTYSKFFAGLTLSEQ